MRLNAAFANVNMGNDWPTIRRLVQELEGAGFDGIATNDHVVGGHPDRAPGEKVHTHTTGVHEPLVLLSFIAAVTERVEITTGILILPQRQTTLVAKQCAELDLLSGGRLRVGVGGGTELDGVRGPQRGLHQPGPTHRGAGRGVAPLLDRGAGHL